MDSRSGGWEPPATRKAAEDMLVKHFGDSILQDNIVTAPIRDGQPGLAYLFGQIGHNIAAFNAIRDSLLTNCRHRCRA